MLLKKIVDNKNNEVKIHNIPKTNEEYITVTFGGFRFLDSYQFLCSSLDSLVKTIIDSKTKMLKNLTNGTVGEGKLSKNVIELETLTSQDRISMI